LPSGAAEIPASALLPRLSQTISAAIISQAYFPSFQSLEQSPKSAGAIHQRSGKAFAIPAGVDVEVKCDRGGALLWKEQGLTSARTQA
jgi:hypothetical protein